VKLVHAAAIAAAVAVVAAPGAFAKPPPGARSGPVEIAVPAEVVAAHPNGRALHAIRVEAVDRATAERVVQPDTEPAATGEATARRLQGARRALASGCWRVYLEITDNNWFFGKAETHVNPAWCGNGYWLTSINNSWRYQVCTNLISCNGLSGPYLAVGCWSCDQAWFQLNGHFSGLLSVGFSFVQHIVWAVYGNGQWWAYYWQDS
jgi:hypothetical protein